jgi:hypothetical protein
MQFLPQPKKTTRISNPTNQNPTNPLVHPKNLKNLKTLKTPPADSKPT